MASDEGMPGAGPAWKAYMAMVAAGSLGLLPLLSVFKQSAPPVDVGAWQLVAAYAAVLVYGSHAAPRSARALARGDGLLVGPLLGAGAFVVGAFFGCTVNVILAEPAEGEDPFWDLGGEPFATLLVVGLLPALLVGFVFTAVMSPWVPKRPPPPRRPPED